MLSFEEKIINFIKSLDKTGKYNLTIYKPHARPQYDFSYSEEGWEYPNDAKDIEQFVQAIMSALQTQEKDRFYIRDMEGEELPTFWNVLFRAAFTPEEFRQVVGLLTDINKPEELNFALDHLKKAPAIMVAPYAQQLLSFGIDISLTSKCTKVFRSLIEKVSALSLPEITQTWDTFFHHSRNMENIDQTMRINSVRVLLPASEQQAFLEKYMAVKNPVVLEFSENQVQLIKLKKSDIATLFNFKSTTDILNSLNSIVKLFEIYQSELGIEHIVLSSLPKDRISIMIESSSGRTLDKEQVGFLLHECLQLESEDQLVRITSRPEYFKDMITFYQLHRELPAKDRKELKKLKV